MRSSVTVGVLEDVLILLMSGKVRA